jgi:hypothetical protein
MKTIAKSRKYKIEIVASPQICRTLKRLAILGDGPVIVVFSHI